NLTYLLSHVHFNTSSKHSSSSPPLPLPLPTIIDATNLTHVNVLNIPIANMKEPIVNPDMWVCGSGKLSESGSFYTVLNWCREKMPELNECCSVHDSCYRLKVGTREVCDDKFCDCIENALSKPQGMDQFCISNSKIAPHNYCPLVKNYGEDAYNYDTNKWFPQYHPVLNQTANAAYMRLYGQCR
uniref:Phospholipase A(2) n=1 Tax=Caenorhabditis japonica TaxID=281687 RepID=A0A8R1DWS0_CAEJA